MRILGVIGSLRDKSHTAHLVHYVLAAAQAAGAETRLLDLRVTPLPLYADHEDYSGHDAIRAVRADLLWAEGFVVGSPEYHGSMTGATKNWFDHYYHEFAGKCFALVGATGGGPGTSCFTHMRATVQFCHGWTLPYHVGVEAAKFRPDGPPEDPKILERLTRLGRDIAVYSQLLNQQFETDLDQSPAPGFASFHQRRRGQS